MISMERYRRGYDRVRTRLRPVTGRLYNRIEVDTRSLAAVRISLGLIILIDLAYRAPYIEMFYTDDGAYTRAAAELTYTQYNGLSIHALSGDLWFQQLMFVVAGLFAVALILGYRTRLVGFVSLVLLLSLHARNPAVLNGGDRLFRVLLLVSLVAPLGERWSVDALRRGSARGSVASVGTVVVLLQPVVVFTSNAILKHQGENWYALDGIEIAMHNDTMTIYLGNIVVEYPTLMTLLNLVWITILAGSALLLLVPVGRLRALVAVGYMIVFSGMLLTMSVGLFPLALMTSVMPFLTRPFWDAITDRVPSRWKARLKGVPRVGPLRQYRDHRLYSIIGERGYRRLRLSARVCVTVLGALVLLWMIVFAVGDVSAYDVPDQVDYTILDQQDWGLYAPDPSESYSWYLVEAQLQNRTTVDALDRGQVSFDRPPDTASEYETFRHRKFLQAVRSSGEYDGSIAKGYARWACRQAEDIYDTPIQRVTVYQMHQQSPLDGEFEPPRKREVIRQFCGY